MRVNEFTLIDTYFKKPDLTDPLVLLGIGDDAACVRVPADHVLLVSMDTLVSGVHFPPDSTPFDIAWRSVMVNLSDLAAMGAEPKWAVLALTLPHLDTHWLREFSRGMHAACHAYGITLIGGDTTKGPLTVTLTVQGLAPSDRFVKRSGASPDDVIFVTGFLGAAALAVAACFHETDRYRLSPIERQILLDRFYHPVPRIDFSELLRHYASSAIDISDGLSADLNHICTSSQVGATLDLTAIPVHSVLKQHCDDKGLRLALSGGDDYEICFTVPRAGLHDFEAAVQAKQLTCYPIGIIDSALGLRQKLPDGRMMDLEPAGYRHF